MPTIAEIRQQFPQYGDLSDQQLADGLHGKFYSDIPRAEFDAKIGIAPASAPTVPGGTPAVTPAAPVQAQAAAAAPEAPGAVGRVAGRAAEVAKDRFGDRPLGLSDQTLSELVERGVIAPEGGTATPIQLLNQITYQYGAKAGDLALRTIAAAIGGIQGAAGQTAEELGASPGMARRLERDVGMLTESAGVVASTPSSTAPRAAPAGRVAAAEAPRAPVGPSPVPAGYVRFYHGGTDPASGGPRWLTPSEDYARNFRSGGTPNQVHYVDVPKGSPTEVAARMWDDVDAAQPGNNMVGRYGSIEAPEDVARMLKPVDAPATQATPPSGAKTAVAIKSPAGAADFKAASQNFYKQFEDAGVMVKPESYARLADDIFATAAKNRLNQTLTPGSMEAVKQIRELADPKVGPITFETLDTMRGVAGDARQAAKKGSNDARVAGLIIDKIDDYIANIKTGDVLAGDAATAAKAIPVARELWSRSKKLETVTDLIDRAQTSAGQFSGSGFENALTTEFRSLAKNKERMKTYSTDEQKAIKLVARGTTATKAARMAGKLAPTGVVSGALGGGIGAAAGTAIGIGPVAGAIAAGSIGFAGRNIATALTKRSIRQLEDMIRQGGDSRVARSALDRATALLGNLERAGTATIPAPAASARDRLRKAPDGNFYLPDPKRPGKYLQLVP